MTKSSSPKGFNLTLRKQEGKGREGGRWIETEISETETERLRDRGRERKAEK